MISPVGDSSCRWTGGEGWVLEPLLDPAHGGIEQLGCNRAEPAASQQSRLVLDDHPKGHLDLGTPNVRTDGHRHADPDRWHMWCRLPGERHRCGSSMWVGVA